MIAVHVDEVFDYRVNECGRMPSEDAGELQLSLPKVLP